MKVGEDASMAASNGADIDVRFAGLQQRVAGLETSVQNVSNQISSLANVLNERGRTPWGLLITGGGLTVTILVVLGGLAYAPIRAGIDRADRDIIDLRSASVSVASFLDFKATYENNRIASRNDNDAKFAAVRADLDAKILRLETALQDQVPRGEHERVWTAYDQRFADVQRQLDEVKQNQASTYGVRDVILDYRDRLDRLERARTGASPTG